MIDWSASYASAAARIATRKALELKPSAVSYEKLSKRIAEIPGSDDLKEQLDKIGFPTKKMAASVSGSTINNFVKDDGHSFNDEAYLYALLGLLALDHPELILPEIERHELADKQRFTVAATELLGLDASGISAPTSYAGVYRLFRPHTLKPTKLAMLCRFTVGSDNDAFACVLEQGFRDDDGLPSAQRATGRLVPCGPRMIAVLQLRVGCPIVIMIDTTHTVEPKEGIRRMSGIMSIMSDNKKACAYPIYAVREQSEFEPTEVQFADVPERAQKAFAQGVIHWDQQA